MISIPNNELLQCFIQQIKAWSGGTYYKGGFLQGIAAVYAHGQGLREKPEEPFITDDHSLGFRDALYGFIRPYYCMDREYLQGCSFCAHKQDRGHDCKGQKIGGA